MCSAKITPAAAFAIVCLTAASLHAGTFPDFGYTPPPAWTDPMFELSQDYPATEPPAEVVPWKTIDFKTKPAEYLQAVLAYSFEGNVAVDFVVQDNAVRKWYHAPWLHWGSSGRDFVRGLTRERLSREFELAATQTDEYRNFAVGFYNPRGAYTIGKVWADPVNPDAADVDFLEDAVSFKLLFTTAPGTVVPYLVGSPEWTADIDRSPNVNTIKQTKVRLLQIDVAVRDNRSACGGWVFGTFQFDGDLPGSSPWEKLRPLALMWGNDPALKQSDYNAGQRPMESWINVDAPIVKYRTNPPAGATPPRVMGWAGRANGPVDNPVSSCLSCHSTAQIPATSRMIPRANLPEPQKLKWFRNLAVGESFDPGSKTLDFSLQLGVGIQNQQEFVTFAKNFGGVKVAEIRPSAEPSAAPAAAAPQQFRFTRDPDE